MIGMFRSQLWGKAMGVNLTDFVDRKAAGTKPVLFEKSLPVSGVLCVQIAKDEKPAAIKGCGFLVFGL